MSTELVSSNSERIDTDGLGGEKTSESAKICRESESVAL